MEIDVEVRDLGEGKGRALFALRDFAKGDVIIREFPLAAAQFSWNKTCKYRACDHCLKSIETATEMARLVNDVHFGPKLSFIFPVIYHCCPCLPYSALIFTAAGCPE